MPEAIQAASIYILASLKDEVTGELKRVKGEVDDLSGNFRKGIGALGDFGSALSSLVAPLGLIGGIGISTAAGFDQSMATISARAGLVGADLDRVRKFALDMGAQFPVSSTEAADALGELLASGQSTEEALATLPAVLTAASASGESLGTVTDVVTGILAAFNIEASESANVVDILSAAAAVSKANIADLGAGFDNVGAIASQFGLSVKDTAAALAILSNANIKGAEGGTALKSLFTQLNSKVGQKELKALGTSLYYTKSQIQEIIKTNKALARDGMPTIPVPKAGDIRPFADVLSDIEKKLGKMTDKERNKAMDLLGGSFGKVALSALLAGDSIEEVERQMDKQASASEVANARMSSFQGVITNLQGSVEALMINAFTPFMNNVLTPLTTKVNEVVMKINEWVVANPELMTQIVSVGAALLLLGGGAVSVAFLVDKLVSLGSAFGTLFSAAAPVILPLLVIGGLVTAYITNFAGFRDAVNDLATAFNNLDPASKGIIIGLGAIGLIASGVTLPIGAAATAMWGLVASVAAFMAPLLVIGGLFYAYLTNLGGFRTWVDGIGDGFRNLDPAAKVAVGGIALLSIGFLALKSSLVAGMLSTWIANIGVALSAAYASGGIVGIATTVVSGLAGAFSLMLAPLAPLAAGLWAVISPVLAVAAPIALVAGLIYAYMENLGGFKDFIDGFGNWLREGFAGWEKAGQAVGAFVDFAVSKLIEFKDWVLKGILSPFKDVIILVQKMANALGDTALAAGMQELLNIINGTEGKYNAENNNIKSKKAQHDAGKATGGKIMETREVGEGNQPEIYKEQGKTYLVPGNKGGGTVFPRFKGSAGGGGLNIGNITLPGVRDPEQFLQELEMVAKRKNRGLTFAAGV